MSQSSQVLPAAAGFMPLVKKYHLASLRSMKYAPCRLRLGGAGELGEFHVGQAAAWRRSIPV